MVTVFNLIFLVVEVEGCSRTGQSCHRPILIPKMFRFVHIRVIKAHHLPRDPLSAFSADSEPCARTFEHDDVIRKSACQQKARAAGYRTESSRCWTAQPVSVLEQILGRKGVSFCFQAHLPVNVKWQVNRSLVGLS